MTRGPTLPGYGRGGASAACVLGRRRRAARSSRPPGSPSKTATAARCRGTVLAATGTAVCRGARDPALRRRRVRAVPAARSLRRQRPRSRWRNSATTTSSARCSSAIVTTPSFGEVVGARQRRAPDVGRRRRVRARRLSRPTICRSSTTRSPCPACSCSTTSTSPRRCRSASSGRLDVHSEYGTFFSPRVSALVRSGPWTSRMSIGTGFFAPVAADRGNRGGRPVAAADPGDRCAQNAG